MLSCCPSVSLHNGVTVASSLTVVLPLGSLVLVCSSWDYSVFHYSFYTIRSGVGFLKWNFALLICTAVDLIAVLQTVRCDGSSESLFSVAPHVPLP